MWLRRLAAWVGDVWWRSRHAPVGPPSFLRSRYLDRPYRPDHDAAGDVRAVVEQINRDGGRPQDGSR